MESYRVLLGTYPDDYAAHSNIGLLYRDQGKIKEALDHFKEAVRLAPVQPIARSSLGPRRARSSRKSSSVRSRLLPETVSLLSRR